MAILNRKVNTSPLVNEEKVKDIREDIREDIQNNNVKIPKNPIIYQWWFKTSCFEKLFELLSSEIKEEIYIKEFDGEEYGLLYVGKGKDGYARLVDYHIFDKNNYHLKGVKNGRLSSLRQTLCGLLELPMSQSQQEINKFMDENCFVSFWEVFENLGVSKKMEKAEKKEIEKVEKGIIEKVEKEEIKKYYLPLNDIGNVRISTKHRKILRKSRKDMKN